MTRAERYAQCKALRDEGLMLREIAERVGVAIQTVHDVLTDPTGEKGRARKRRYEHPCIDCGRTVNSNGNRVIERCRACKLEQQRGSGRRYVIESMQEWARRYGAPPSSYDWSPAQVRLKGCVGSLWKIERYEKSGRPWPAVPTVQNLFGSWNEGLRAAGFEPLDPSDHALGRAGAALRDQEAA